MTTVELSNEQAQPEPADSPSGWWQKIDERLESLGEYLNPILVKETRQSLKSRQFAITFGLVLITSWIWSVMAIYLRYPGILYSPDGPFLLVGYLDILLFPLVVIIPFSAFRSLASEREDGTFELLSISTLSPRQIITGKLISSIVQMLVYLSALAPCIGFTYLLRGIDIITIVYVISVAVLTSVLLSGFGLVLACITRQRHWQSALSIIVILLFIFSFGSGMSASYSLVYMEANWRMYDESSFWIATFAILTIYASFLHLIIDVASAQITFESENRSAGIRKALLIQHFLIIGWLGYVAIQIPEEAAFLFAITTILCLYWFIAGSYINGEAAVLSPRVKRTIPVFLFDRLWRNWLIPGPDRGYIFVLTGLFSGTATAYSLAWYNTFNGMNISEATHVMIYSLGIMAYTTFYLSAGRLLLRTMNLLFRADIFISALTHFLLLMAAIMVPLGFQVLYNRTMDSSFNHWTNPFWFFVKSMDDGNFVESPDVIMFLFFLSMLAGSLFLINIVLGAAELVPRREKAPRNFVEILPEDEPELDPLRPS
ncbi:hypothetical protein DTL42_03995 [Bremerella cremea]|uniref:ABC-2 family transporter protein n=1 Tax=Bremerella cremea TaxID=1031537 RepID=A0A368KXD2_9BACT|nr:ABC transporter permease subunit [Bremerella cremea]RCS54315.1 hypothetical protein DTL42_03995 [Bremerella cremea]